MTHLAWVQITSQNSKNYKLFQFITIHQNPELADMVDPKCYLDMLKVPIWVYVFTFYKITKYYRQFWCLTLSKSKLLNTVDSSFHVDMFKRSIGVPQVCFWSCAVQNVIFHNIKKYYGPIWCTMIYQNTKLANVVHTLHFSPLPPPIPHTPGIFLCRVLVTIPWSGPPGLGEFHSIDKK